LLNVNEASYGKLQYPFKPYYKLFLTELRTADDKIKLEKVAIANAL